MAGIVQTTPWSYNPYGIQNFASPGGGVPWSVGLASPIAQPIVQLQQLLQILPQQIQQLQQTIQFLPQHVAQLVLQALAQSQTPFGVPGPFASPSVGFPFQSIPTTSAIPQSAQPNYVM